jgi:hypothetical protein
MINYTDRLDKAIRISAWAHEKQGQHRKGTDIPYIIHPFGVMIIASNATDDEDILIACLMHDVLEDVDYNIYNETKMREDFGDRVVTIVKDVTKDENEEDWHERSKAYLRHLQHKASDEAVIVSASDKIHNLQSILTDYETEGEKLWQRFSTKSSADQIWWYEQIYLVLIRRNAPSELIIQLYVHLSNLKFTLESNKKLPHQNMKEAYLRAAEIYHYRYINYARDYDEWYNSPDRYGDHAPSAVHFYGDHLSDTFMNREEDEMNEYDWSKQYNEGKKYEEISSTDRRKYKNFVQDWGLPEPTGKPPVNKIDLLKVRDTLESSKLMQKIPKVSYSRFLDGVMFK